MLDQSSTLVKFHTVDTLEKAQQDAASAAANTAGQIFPVILFQQGTRQAMTGAFPVGFVRTRLSRKSATRKGSVADAMDAINRPLDEGHAQSVARYIVENVSKPYILPPMTLNVQEAVDVWTTDLQSTMRLAYLVVPLTAHLSITDGQHRQAALQKAAEMLTTDDLRKLDKDSVSVMITCESAVAQVHQDFADCSKTKALPQSQLAVYDRRNPANGIVLDLADTCPLFAGKIDATSSSLSKKALSLFLTNQVRQLVKELLVGSYAEADDMFESKAHHHLGTAGSAQYNAAKAKFIDYINTVTEAIPILKTIAAMNPVTERNKIPALREEGWVCLTATGLNIIGRIGHELVMSKAPAPDWQKYVTKMGAIDWQKSGPLWQGNVIKDGKVMTQQGPVKAAVAAVRCEIGLTPQDLQAA
jgi:DGQHR domain-containing protein